ncbi:MAG: response regulator transcription factor [Clostridiales bacterium]|jgi:DNA-binding response OmpR family regulator|nr:response regulator transcription factor [Clostridiales bacterium]MBQ2605294.1 response regulator transcription factor [Clostridiales bacterium]MBQ4191580.1 response regulator transcription factor [Clostridiales bacterium]MBQ4217159.1 response regulator transcription factor [Clostridiales bacterium]MBQ5423081.1 response regulator transcription factor [Clostridiales bacterium]
MAKHKILIVDDDNDILTLNRDFLVGEGYEVVTATTCSEALAKAQVHNFACLVLDVMLPDGSAFDLAPKIKEFTDAPMIFLTAKDQQEDVIKGFNVGADDYVTKPYSLPELSLRINVHIKRNMKSEGFLIEYPPLSINIRTREVMLKNKPLHLTNREFDILCLLAETPNVIVPFTRIYSHVWGDDSPCDNHLVMVNISYLRKKMEKIAPEITFIKTEWGIGYSFAYPPVKNSMTTQY